MGRGVTGGLRWGYKGDAQSNFIENQLRKTIQKLNAWYIFLKKLPLAFFEAKNTTTWKFHEENMQTVGGGKIQNRPQTGTGHPSRRTAANRWTTNGLVAGTQVGAGASFFFGRTRAD